MLFLGLTGERITLAEFDGRFHLSYASPEGVFKAEAILDRDDLVELISSGIIYVEKVPLDPDVECLTSLELGKSQRKLILCGDSLIKEIQFSNEEFNKFMTYLSSFR